MSTPARVYLDWNASAPLRPEAREAMLAALDLAGNPSSIHAEGRAARALIETAREDVAALVGAEPHNVIFTSGATEAAAMALTPDWGKRKFERLLVSAIEHPCVLAGGRFGAEQISSAPVTGTGTIDISVLKQLLTQHPRPLVALMAANNETGILQPVAEAAALTHAAGGLLVCDAVQAAGRLQTDIAALDADALLLSAHKLGGPKGVGALVLADDKVAPAPLLTGGGQEGRRPRRPRRTWLTEHTSPHSGTTWNPPAKPLIIHVTTLLPSRSALLPPNRTAFPTLHSSISPA